MKGSSTGKRYLAAGCLGLFLAAGLVVIVAVAFMTFPPEPSKQESTLATAREWARLADIPATASILKIETTGSAFTREFSVTFRDSPANIRSWIAASPGPASATRSVDDSGWTLYGYPAGGGAAFAEIRVSPEGDVVRIRTFWS